MDKKTILENALYQLREIKMMASCTHKHNLALHKEIKDLEDFIITLHNSAEDESFPHKVIFINKTLKRLTDTLFDPNEYDDPFGTKALFTTIF